MFYSGRVPLEMTYMHTVQKRAFLTRQNVLQAKSLTLTFQTLLGMRSNGLTLKKEKKHIWHNMHHVHKVQSLAFEVTLLPLYHLTQ